MDMIWLRLLREGTRMRTLSSKLTQSHGVLLPENQVGETGGHRAGILVLAQRSVAVLHAVGHIDHQRAPHICIFFELFDYQPVGPCPHFPIDVPQIIATNVFAMLCKLD